MLSWLPPFPGPSKPSAHLFLAPQPGVGPRRPPFSLAICCCPPLSCWDLYRVLPALALTHVELKAQPLTPTPVFCPRRSASLFCGELLALATILGLPLQSGLYRGLQRCPAHHLDRRRELPESHGGPEPSSLDAQSVPAQALAGTTPAPKALPSQSTRPSAASEPKLAPNPAAWA